jgi:hypothetical protein
MAALVLLSLSALIANFERATLAPSLAKFGFRKRANAFLPVVDGRL